MSALLRNTAAAVLPLLLLLVTFSTTTYAAFINFQDCLDSSITKSDPLQLQFVPLYFDARFQRVSPYNLDVTIYGNVSGKQYREPYPPPDSPHWTNPNSSVLGKIPNVGDAQVITTLFADFTVLTYTAYNAKASAFCPHLVNNASCPLSPYFYADANNPYDLPGIQVTHGFGSAYEFATLDATISVISGDNGSPHLACVSANITPDLGSSITRLITWLPAAILIFKGLATLTAAMFSPWGSSDIFRWSSNYGRDEDLLRLVTPGFGDCLQYIQFVTLMGTMTLSFPGYFRPAVSNTAWSLLLFNSSYVSHGSGTQSLIDGIYVTNGTYGLDDMYQLIGMSKAEDVWASMAIWLAVIAIAVVLLCQLGFLSRWVYRAATKTTEEDLRRKNLPFTLGNMIRLLFNYFILPIVALSLFQLVISPTSLSIPTAFAAVLLLVLICCTAWILRVIFTTKPRTYLFDDMPTVLLYGPLYNTYSDSAAPFALVPVLITFMRGVAFGAVQPSGAGQIVIVAICEIILIITLNGFRPFQNQTSMNAYHTFFAAVRLATVLLCIAFIPALGVTEPTKGWIGYVILLLHACVLVFGFFLNSAQTIFEVAARSLGLAGYDASNTAIRGSILNWRMLKQRKKRPIAVNRASTASNAAILRTSRDEMRSWQDGRSRSMSASSHQLLNQGAPTMRSGSGFEVFGDGKPSPNTEPELGNESFTFVADATGKPALSLKNDETFYRPPRARKNTIELLNGKSKTQSFGSMNEFPYRDSPPAAALQRGSAGSPAPAYLRDRADSDADVPRTDYAVREVDQYYRGQALSDLPTRKLKTGPADPQGPAASAQSWLQRLVFGVKGNKKKDQAKGFEVVRSSRAPPGNQPPDGAADETVELQNSPALKQEPYRDVPESSTAERPRDSATEPERPISPLTEAERRHISKGHNRLVSVDTEDGNAAPRASGVSTTTQRDVRSIRPDSDTIAPVQMASIAATQEQSILDRQQPTRPSHDTGRSSHYDHSQRSSNAGSEGGQFRLSTLAPSLAPVEMGNDTNLPSRFDSHRTTDSDRTITQSASGQRWLRDVDNLQWQHNDPSAASQGTVGHQPQQSLPNINSTPRVVNHQPQQSMAFISSPPRQMNPIPETTAQPFIPARSARRPGSGNHTPSNSVSNAAITTETPTQTNPNTNTNTIMPNFDFGHFDLYHGSQPGENDSAPNSPNYFENRDSIATDEQRASSVMNTSRHRAGDSITRNSFGANAALNATSAELLGSSPPEREFGDLSRARGSSDRFGG